MARHGLLKPRKPDTVYWWLDLYERDGLFWLKRPAPRGRPPEGPLTCSRRVAQAEELTERLRRPPDPPDPPAPAAEARGRAGGGRLDAEALQAAFPWLAHYRSLSGVWRAVRRRGQRLRRGRPRQFSPDPDYVAKEALPAGRAAPGGRVGRAGGWPLRRRVHLPPLAAAGADLGAGARAGAGGRAGGAGRAPAADRRRAGRRDGAGGQPAGQLDQREHLRRLPAPGGAGLPGGGDGLCGGRQLAGAQPTRRWLAALAKLDAGRAGYLPTYAPWLNPIEKLWGWLKEAELRQHGLAGRWAALQRRVTAFLAQFADGSAELLGRVGLLGEGKLAGALRPAPIPPLARQT